MKGEYLDPKHNDISTITTTATATTPTTAPTVATPNDGATIEVVRLPRGRPPGSKNKPKPPVIITPEPPMSPHVLEIPNGNDVVEVVSKFCRRRNLGLCILAASGAVSNFTLRQPCSAPSAAVTFHGRFDILSISGSFLPPQGSPNNITVPNTFNLSLAGPQGQIIGGTVAGPLVAAGSVFLVAATFSNAAYHRLTEDEEGRKGGVSSEGHAQSSPGASGGEHAPPSGGGVQTPESSTGGVSMYSCHLPSDVMWTPPGHVHGHGSRQPAPHHHHHHHHPY